MDPVWAFLSFLFLAFCCFLLAGKVDERKFLAVLCLAAILQALVFRLAFGVFAGTDEVNLATSIANFQAKGSFTYLVNGFLPVLFLAWVSSFFHVVPLYVFFWLSILAQPVFVLLAYVVFRRFGSSVFSAGLSSAFLILVGDYLVFSRVEMRPEFFGILALFFALLAWTSKKPWLVAAASFALPFMHVLSAFMWLCVLFAAGILKRDETSKAGFAGASLGFAAYWLALGAEQLVQLDAVFSIFKDAGFAAVAANANVFLAAFFAVLAFSSLFFSGKLSFLWNRAFALLGRFVPNFALKIVLGVLGAAALAGAYFFVGFELALWVIPKVFLVALGLYGLARFRDDGLFSFWAPFGLALGGVFLVANDWNAISEGVGLRLLSYAYIPLAFFAGKVFNFVDVSRAAVFAAAAFSALIIAAGFPGTIDRPMYVSESYPNFASFASESYLGNIIAKDGLERVYANYVLLPKTSVLDSCENGVLCLLHVSHPPVNVVGVRIEHSFLNSVSTADCSSSTLVFPQAAAELGNGSLLNAVYSNGRETLYVCTGTR